ncbi:MAG: threonine synthase [Bacteroidota bacterium]
MKLYSTNNKTNIVDLKEAVFKSLPTDKGLYMPCNIPTLPSNFIKSIGEYDFSDLAFEVCKNLFQGRIPEQDLKEIIKKSITFPAPLVHLHDQQYILELFHGPSLAFKDFGARFMAQLMSYFLQEEQRKLTILVATSGDTGGAVAAGFYKTPGIEVIILYPSGKVSDLQEKQLTTLGKNITALEIDGTFDDCQAIVKRAFLDAELNTQYNLSSANSINIARLIPQSFYYFEAYKQLDNHSLPTVFCIPSGNFGNLTAGLLAQKMGLPVNQFIAATNMNKIVPDYLSTGEYNPKPSLQTISNAMDVGKPSNFARMVDLHEGSTWNNMKENITGNYCDDKTTRKIIKDIYTKYDYVMCPHTAVGYHAAQEYTTETANIITLATAHPSKFIDTVEEEIGDKINIPDRLAVLKSKKKDSVELDNQFSSFKKWIQKR